VKNYKAEVAGVSTAQIIEQLY